MHLTRIISGVRRRGVVTCWHRRGIGTIRFLDSGGSGDVAYFESRDVIDRIPVPGDEVTFVEGFSTNGCIHACDIASTVN
jgi:hypothetical protein